MSEQEKGKKKKKLPAQNAQQMGLKESLRREEEEDEIQTSIQAQEGCHSRKRKMERREENSSSPGR